MNVSLSETDCLPKSLNCILFSSCLCIMHIKIVFISLQICFVYIKRFILFVLFIYLICDLLCY